MRYGYWMPVFGGWLRNVPDEGMEASWDYAKRLTLASEAQGWDLTLIAELNLNDIKGVEQPALDAWSTAAALAAVTSSIELMVAVRPNFHHPALFAKAAANIDLIAKGRLSLNVVSSWWADEARQYGLQFDQHDDRYARTREWLQVVDGLWTQERFSFAGSFYSTEEAICAPKPAKRPVVYAGGESEAAKAMIAKHCDAYVMHGDPVAAITPKIADMAGRRQALHAERDENSTRKDFTPSEKAAIFQADLAGVFAGRHGGDRRSKNSSVKYLTLENKDKKKNANRSATLAAARAGFGNRTTAEHAVAVVELQPLLMPLTSRQFRRNPFPTPLRFGRRCWYRTQHTGQTNSDTRVTELVLTRCFTFRKKQFHNI